MSTDTNPIDPARFAVAVADLPVDTLHAKAAEIQNSIGHLRESNAQMLPFADDGDQDCKEAMFENLQVIGRMRERIDLLRAEVEKRGLRWTEGEADGEAESGRVNGVGPGAATQANGEQTVSPGAPSGRLTDDELRRQLEARMADNEDEGLHL